MKEFINIGIPSYHAKKHGSSFGRIDSFQNTTNTLIGTLSANPSDRSPRRRNPCVRHGVYSDRLMTVVLFNDGRRQVKAGWSLLCFVGIVSINRKENIKLDQSPSAWTYAALKNPFSGVCNLFISRSDTICVSRRMQMPDWELEAKDRRVTHIACHFDTFSSKPLEVSKSIYDANFFEYYAQKFEQSRKGVW